ncbi:MAG: pirin family protein [Nocardioides sp.]
MSGLQVLQPREVPLGGPRAMRVRRTLPARGRTLIGAWCFVDHYGPDDVAATRGMSVAPHPHTGLQTVSWLFTGEIEHRDSAGHPAFVRPGELNLMTAGRGISHTEVSTQRTRVLHGVQLWLALPDADRHVPPGLQHHVPERVRRDGWSLRVFLGSLDGVTAPVPTYTPLLGAELVLDAAVTVTVELDPAFEHGVLVDGGTLLVGGEQLTEHRLGYLGPGRSRLELQAVGDEPVRLLLPGAPFGEKIVMWWNFVGRSHDEIAAFRAVWQAQITRDGEVVTDGRRVGDGRFGNTGDPLPPIPAPELPRVRLKARG